MLRQEGLVFGEAGFQVQVAAEGGVFPVFRHFQDGDVHFGKGCPHGCQDFRVAPVPPAVLDSGGEAAVVGPGEIGLLQEIGEQVLQGEFAGDAGFQRFPAGLAEIEGDGFRGIFQLINTAAGGDRHPLLEVGTDFLGGLGAVFGEIAAGEIEIVHSVSSCL